MKIEKNTVATIRYKFRIVDDVEKIEGPWNTMMALIGHNQLLPGIEQALLDHEKGQSVEVELSPQQAYGDYQEGMVQRVPKRYFSGTKLQTGMPVTMQTKEGPRSMTVLKIGMSVVDVDLNHPLAGQTLHFTIEIQDVRAATAEEIDHGHAHGDAEGAIAHS